MKITQQGFQQNMVTSPNETRKRRMILIIACAALITSLLTLPSFLYYKDPGMTLIQDILANREVFQITLVSLFGILISLLTILLIRKMKNTWLPGILITAGIFVLIIFSDDFTEVAGGRSTFFFSIPIFVSAITIGPSSTFVFAALTSIILFLRPDGIMDVNIYAVPAVWILSLSIWLATSTMEKAIHTAQQETNRVRAMLGVVSHELRTPLGSISGYADLLLLDKRMDNIQSEMLARVKGSTTHLNELVNRLLDSAHIQSGKLILKPVSVSTDTLFDVLVERAAKLANDKGLQFVYQKGELPPAISIDLIRLQQIVSNLTDNAIKFTEKGLVTLRVEQVKKNMLIVVSDTGIGIPEADIPLLFQEFTQFQHYATREYGGVGLGLSIVYHLVKLMQGSIVVDSKVGAGTTMSVTLPLAQILPKGEL